MYDSMEFLFLNDFSMSCLIFNVYILYFFTKLGISMLIPNHIPLISWLSETGHSKGTQLMIVSDIVL